MASHHFPADGSTHLRGRLRFALGAQTTGYLGEIGIGKTGGRTEKNPVTSFLDREFRAWRPRSGSADGLRQDDLTLGRKPCGFHR
jgi:hypothetical protein